jgi:glycosyltransferase involved in cell wall biosynthesis
MKEEEDVTRKPARILQALTKGEVGGTELMVLQLVRGLDRVHFAPEVSFLDGYGPITNRVQETGTPVHDLSGPGGLLGTMRRILSLLHRSRFHIVHLYGFRMSLLGRVAARFVFPRPVVAHGIRGLHVTEGEDVACPRTKFAIAVERLGASWVDSYIANSQGAMTFLSIHGVPKEKFIVIPNGIDLGEWPPSPIQSITATPTIICVANFRPRKRHRDLIESLGILLRRGVQVRCRLVGDGDVRREVEALVRQQQLNGIVQFTGSRTPQEVQMLLRSSDIFVLPSLWEGMPGSVMEAMAAGLPVVGTDVAGTRELVLDGTTGYLVPAKNPQQLAARLQRLLEDPALRVRMGEEGRKRIEQHFSLAVMVRRHEEAYLRFFHGRTKAA